MANSRLPRAQCRRISGIELSTEEDCRRKLGLSDLKSVNLPVVEKILNHTSGSFRGVVGVYQRHGFADEKRAALDAWAVHVDRLINRSAPES